MIQLNKSEQDIISIAEKLAIISSQLANHLTSDIANYYAINIGTSKAERTNFQFHKDELDNICDWLSQFLFSSTDSVLNKLESISNEKIKEHLFIHFSMIVTDPFVLNKLENSFESIIKMRPDYDLLFSGKIITELTQFSHLYSIDESIIKEIIEDQFLPTKEKNEKITKPDFSANEFDSVLYNKILLHPELVKQMHWREFEKLLAKILEAFEYEIELSKGSKDGGVDLIAIKKNTDFGEHKYLIQAKRYNNKVGIEPVERLMFLRQEYGASKACLVTTSQFTAGAWKHARNYNYLLELKDFERLQVWIKQAEFIEKNKHLK